MCINRLRNWVLIAFGVIAFISLICWFVVMSQPDKSLKCGRFVEITRGSLLNFHDRCTGQLHDYTGMGNYKVTVTCHTEGLDTEGESATWTQTYDMKRMHKNRLKLIHPRDALKSKKKEKEKPS